MTSSAERLERSVSRLRALVGERDASVCAGALADDALLAGLAEVTDARTMLDLLEAAFSAEVEKRSDRSFGYAGLAQRKGHRNGTALVQHVTGKSRPEIERATRTGRDLAAVVEAPQVDGGGAGAGGAGVDADAEGRRPDPAWFSPLTSALQTGALSRDQYDTIRRNLGEPPIGRYPEPELLEGAWREAAVALIEEATDRSVEDLRAAARLARDTLDPIGTQLRFEERFANRGFTMWVDENGQQNARIRFDDDMAAWVRTILSAALRPRRGPRFVDPDERRRGDAEVESDSRTNEQLQYDTLVAVLRTGAEADPRQAFGDRQPGIRIVVTQESVDLLRDDRQSAVGHLEETGQTIPGAVLASYLCNTATKVVTVDTCGNPLNVGRDKRLFTKKQRDAMAIRDGGCLWCGAEPSRCEAHHIDHWGEHLGRTDIADGVLLCRNCHMRLHNQQWRITRDERGSYWLNAPPGAGGSPNAPPRLLRSRSLSRFTRSA